MAHPGRALRHPFPPPVNDSHATPDEWLKALPGRAARHFRLLRLLAPLTGALIVAQAWLLARIVDSAAFAGEALDSLTPWLLALLPVILLRFLAQWRSERLADLAAAQVKRELRDELIERIAQAGPVHLANQQSGRLAAGLIDAVEAIDPFLARYLPARILMGMVPLVILMVVLPTDWISGIVLLVTAPLVPLFMTLIGRQAERLNQRQWRELARMGGYFLNVLQALPTLKMFNASRREGTRIARVSEDFRRSTMQVLRVAFLTSAVLEFLAAISIALIAVFIGFRLLDGEMAFFHGFFVLLLAPEFYQPLRNFGVQNHARMEAVAAAEQIGRILSLPITSPQSTATTAADDYSGTLSVQGVYFAYGDDRTVLEDLSLEIAPREHLAVVGRSGAGKSTLVNLLLGFIEPDEGSILVGDRPLNACSLAAWRGHIGWVPQRARLFHGSVADNIRLGAPDASMTQVRRAAEAAHALAFIERLPEGFDTLVGEGGQGLSGGQVQRIALARALVRRPDWLLLDEPTAHLDHETERAILETIEALRGRCGIVTIAHRLETLRRADRILVMDRARIVQSGTFEELSRAPGPFAELLHDPAEILP
ncbi:MAG: thiol reductant ABC exporter subunit CydD [Gammaproteobacteria bacterium]|nr:MAG: thiol reductant ABC exporter subunit CydD [Gammaproteobacteria bacterium]